MTTTNMCSNFGGLWDVVSVKSSVHTPWFECTAYIPHTDMRGNSKFPSPTSVATGKGTSPRYFAWCSKQGARERAKRRCERCGRMSNNIYIYIFSLELLDCVALPIVQALA